MRTTIDAAGRVVVPKALRDLLHLRAGQDLDIAFVDGRITLEVAPTEMHLVETPSGVVASADAELPELSADTVRETLEQIRR